MTQVRHLFPQPSHLQPCTAIDHRSPGVVHRRVTDRCATPPPRPAAPPRCATDLSLTTLHTLAPHTTPPPHVQVNLHSPAPCASRWAIAGRSRPGHARQRQCWELRRSPTRRRTAPVDIGSPLTSREATGSCIDRHRLTPRPTLPTRLLTCPLHRSAFSDPTPPLIPLGSSPCGAMLVATSCSSPGGAMLVVELRHARPL